MLHITFARPGGKAQGIQQAGSIALQRAQVDLRRALKLWTRQISDGPKDPHFKAQKAGSEIFRKCHMPL